MMPPPDPYPRLYMVLAPFLAALIVLGYAVGVYALLGLL